MDLFLIRSIHSMNIEYYETLMMVLMIYDTADDSL